MKKVDKARQDGVTPMLVDKHLPTIRIKCSKRYTISFVKKGDTKRSRVNYKFSMKKNNIDFGKCKGTALKKLSNIIQDHYTDVPPEYVCEQVEEYIEALKSRVKGEQEDAPSTNTKKRKKLPLTKNGNTKRVQV